MEQELMSIIKRTGNMVRRLQGQLSPHSNGKGHGRLLRLVAEHDGITSKELALMLGIRPSTLTEKLRTLEQDGMIVRRRDKKDRRMVHIALTPEGYLALRRREAGGNRLQEKLDEVMTQEEQAQFCAQCQTIIEAMEQLSEACRERCENVISFEERDVLPHERVGGKTAGSNS